MRTERGMVTAELAIGILIAGMMAVVACWVVGLVVVQTHCGDAATQVARQLARGDQQAAHEAEGRAPKGAVVRVDRAASMVTVRCFVDERLGHLGPVHLQARAIADLEPGVAR